MGREHNAIVITLDGIGRMASFGTTGPQRAAAKRGKPRGPAVQDDHALEPSVEKMMAAIRQGLRRMVLDGTPGEVALFLDAGADPNARDEHGDAPLHHAVRRWDEGAVVRLLLAAGADPNARGREGNVPLCNPRTEWNIKALLAAGADPNAKDRDGDPVLHVLSRDRLHWSFVETILAAGADIEARGGNGRTVLMNAASRGSTAAVERLLELGVDIEATDGEGNTAMDIASTAAVAEMLLKSGWKGQDPARTAAALSKHGSKSFDRIAGRIRRMERKEVATGMSKPSARTAARRI